MRFASCHMHSCVDSHGLNFSIVNQSYSQVSTYEKYPASKLFSETIIFSFLFIHSVQYCLWKVGGLCGIGGHEV